MSTNGVSDTVAHFRKAVCVVWTLPYTCFGLAIGLIGLVAGGSASREGLAIEFHGRLVGFFLDRFCGKWVSAITFGHTILGRNADTLARCRDHEWVHVRQYERWGPFFGPAYLFSSLVVWLQGKDAYRDNHFEREAYGDDTNPNQT